MKKENLIILGLLAIGVYFYFDKKKKDRFNFFSNKGKEINFSGISEEDNNQQLIQPIRHLYTELPKGALEPKVIKLISKK